MGKEYFDIVDDSEIGSGSLTDHDIEDAPGVIEEDLAKYHIKRVILSPTRWKLSFR